MASKTKEQIADEMTLYIKDLNDGIDTQSGSVVSDAFIQPQSTILELGYADLDNINGSFNPSNWANMSDYQIEQLAETWGLKKKSAVASSVTITFYKRTIPTTPITIPSGTIVTSVLGDTSNSLSFYSTSEVVLDSTKWNQTTGRYEVSVLMTCSTSGADTNIASGTIINTSINNIDGCINKSASYGGKDAESNEALANRIIVASQGRVLGTVPGYSTLVGEIGGISDVAIVTADDSDATRSTYGNEVDIVVVGETAESVIDEIAYDEQTNIILSQQPVLNINYVKNATTDTILPATAYTFVADTGTATKGSVNALDKITINAPSYFSVGDTIEIGYEINGLIAETQDYLELTDNKIISSNVLVREGTKELINMAFTVSCDTTKSKSDMKQELTDAVYQYINSLQLGDAIEQSDIVYLLRSRFSYIGNIVVPFSTLVVRPTVPPYFTGTASDLYPTKFTYYRADDDSIDITVI